MIQRFTFLIFLLPTMAFSAPKMPVGKELFKAEEFVKANKLPDAELLTFQTNKTFKQLREELQGQLGETWAEVAPPKVEIPKELQEQVGLLQNMVILENTENPKFRVSITLIEDAGMAEGKSLLLLTLMRNYQTPQAKKTS